MEKELLLKDKKGVSIMIGYVLLIVIAISLSVLTFAFLKLYLPSERPICPNDISLIMTEVVCSNETIRVALENKGLFGVDGAFIRVGEQGKIFKKLINEGSELFASLPPQIFNGTKLNPGETLSLTYSYNATTPQQEIEIEPFVRIESKTALC